MMQFTILHRNLELLQVNFDKLNKKCQKYGNETLSFTNVGEPYTEDKQLWQKIEVAGCTPLVGDYQLVGVISKLDDGTNSIQNVPGQELPLKFREADFQLCEHCHTRRYRKEIVVVKDKQDNYIQLGKTCLKDYLGINLEHLVNKFSWVYELCENAKGESFGSSQEYVVEPESYLACVNVCIRKLGWISSKQAYENGYEATKTTAFNVMFPTTPFIRRFIEKNELFVELQDRQIAKEGLEWVATLDDSKSDFIYNVKNIARQEYIRYKHIGYIAAIVMMYRKHIEKKIHKEKEKSKPSEWFGEVKKRYELSLTCVFLREFDTPFGVTTLFKLVDNDGNQFVWFASNDPGIDQGETYKLVGTVKKHDTYNDQKQTVLTRCKLVKEKV